MSRGRRPLGRSPRGSGHNVIHALFSEKELARRLSDTEALRAEPEIATFIAWVRTKPDDFHALTRRARDKR